MDEAILDKDELRHVEDGYEAERRGYLGNIGLGDAEEEFTPVEIIEEGIRNPERRDFQPTFMPASKIARVNTNDEDYQLMLEVAARNEQSVIRHTKLAKRASCMKFVGGVLVAGFLLILLISLSTTKPLTKSPTSAPTFAVPTPLPTEHPTTMPSANPSAATSTSAPSSNDNNESPEDVQEGEESS